jgi:hypothetical protein
MTNNILNPIPLITMAIYSELGVCSLQFFIDSGVHHQQVFLPSKCLATLHTHNGVIQESRGVEV